jgi:hypothetical protein
VKIDKNIPLPSRIANRVTVGPLPLEDLRPGDSILIDCNDNEIDRVLHSVRVRLSRFSSKNKDYKFSSSKAKGGVRIWRV